MPICGHSFLLKLQALLNEKMWGCTVDAALADLLAMLCTEC